MSNTKGESNLDILIKGMDPILNEGIFVFTTVASLDPIPRNITLAEFKEKEGFTIVLSKEDAIHYGLSFEYEASWITLNIHSALDASGLTAAFSTELANHNISCNVIAGYYHDHIFVEVKDSINAISVLRAMKTTYQSVSSVSSGS